jgi:drug/metabolite transporter, DME family
VVNVSEKAAFPPVLYILAAVLLWSTGGLFIKLAALDAFQVTFYRSLFAALTVLAFVLLKGRARQALRISAFGLVCTLIYSTLLFLFVWATKHTTAANAIFLQYTAPIYILILAPFVIGERFHIRNLVTVVFCIGGMSLFFVGDLTLGETRGNIAALGSGVFLGLYIMLLKHPKAVVSRGPGASGGTQDLSPMATVVYGNFLLTLVTLPPGIASVPTITALDLAAVAFLGIFQIGISYILFIKGVTLGTRPLDASIIGFIEPLLNPVWVFLFIGERPANWALLGGAVIVTTVAAHTIAQYRNRTQQPA